MAIFIGAVSVVAGIIAIITAFIVCVKFGARVLSSLQENTKATVENAEATRTVANNLDSHVEASNQIHLELTKSLSFLEGRTHR